jgi:hypothetical protein
MCLWNYMLLTHLHNRLEVGRLIGSVKWLYHSHPDQSEAKVGCCQYQAGLPDEMPDRVLI